jgi:hypothetical protein
LHGGSNPIKHGRYSLVHRQALAEKQAQYLADPHAGDLRAELALMRALLQHHLDRFPDGVALPTHEVERIFDMVESISRLVERIAKILSQTALTQAELQLLQVAILSALPEFIPDADRQRDFVSRLFGSFGRIPRSYPASVGAIDAE